MNLTAVKRVYPKYFPNWFRPVYCWLRGIHGPLYIYAGLEGGHEIHCGICGTLRLKIKE